MMVNYWMVGVSLFFFFPLNDADNSCLGFFPICRKTSLKHLSMKQLDIQDSERDKMRCYIIMFTFSLQMKSIDVLEVHCILSLRVQIVSL